VEADDSASRRGPARRTVRGENRSTDQRCGEQDR